MLTDSSSRALIETRLKSFVAVESNQGIAAAVALIITEAGFGADLPGIISSEHWQKDAALLLTRRAAHLKRNARQWALPGGRVDNHETKIQTAIRETHEEINLVLTEHDYLGRLDDYVTRTGFVMSPFVFWGGKAEALSPSPDEVESIHRIPISEFLREDAPILDYDELSIEEQSSTNNNPVLRMPVGHDWIAAPTAALLYQFREVCLLNKTTRVAHFEQPKFAWK